MNKFLSKKLFFDLEDAAKFLSLAHDGADVTVADVLQLVDENQLTLSLDFREAVPARFGKVVPESEAQRYAPRGLDLEGPREFEGERIFLKQVLECEDLVLPISGVWDLVRTHDGGSEIRRLFDEESGKAIARKPRTERGLIVVYQREDDRYAWLQEGSLADSTKLRPLYFDPSARLPSVARLVIRREDLDKFCGNTSEGKPLHGRERKGYLNLISGLITILLTDERHNRNRETIKTELLQRFPNTEGLSLPNLSKKFSDANKTLPIQERPKGNSN